MPGLAHQAAPPTCAASRLPIAAALRPATGATAVSLVGYYASTEGGVAQVRLEFPHGLTAKYVDFIATLGDGAVVARGGGQSSAG